VPTRTRAQIRRFGLEGLDAAPDSGATDTEAAETPSDGSWASAEIGPSGGV